jgi:ketosteroid isomerase-like protein
MRTARRRAKRTQGQEPAIDRALRTDERHGQIQGQCVAMTIDDLEAFCACWNRHDIEGLMSFMTDDCVFMSSAGPDACGARYVGRDAVRRGFMAAKLRPERGVDLRVTQPSVW